MWGKKHSITNNSTHYISLISFFLLFSVFGEFEYNAHVIDQNLQMLINMANVFRS